MPTIVTIGPSPAPGIFHATAKISGKDFPEVQGDILLKEVEPGKFKPFLDARIKISKIANREVAWYKEFGTEIIEGIKEGMVHTFKNPLMFSLNKN